MPHIYFIGVDVGTSSARAALIGFDGHVLKSHVKPIKTWNPKPDHYEQSSSDIWSAVCECVKTVSAETPKEEIVGIGFDATCSLVVLDKTLNPVTVSSSGDDNQNIILWMDHRASEEADQINSTKHEILNYVGGRVSLEMEIPKILWIKNNLRLSTWQEAAHFFDLPDFLTWKSTGNLSRSLCSVVCKWNFDGVKNEWSRDYLEKIGLQELCENNFEKLGTDILAPGAPIEGGLSFSAAEDLGLMPETAVAASIIDAHAGALALLGSSAEGISTDLTSKLGVICGTSTCHMSVSEIPIWADGFWGPYKGALYSEMFLTEAGQSATGILIEHVVKTHPAYSKVFRDAGDDNIYQYINKKLTEMAQKRHIQNVQELTRDIHVWPDFHGNRTPLADPTLRGMISGLSMSTDDESLALIYLATIQSLAYGTKHIVDSLLKCGRKEFKSILICGGLSNNMLFVQTHADVCSIPVLLPKESESVLIGAGILGACAARVFPNLSEASKAMGGKSVVVTPNSSSFPFHNAKYQVFLKMLADQREYRDIMSKIN